MFTLKEILKLIPNACLIGKKSAKVSALSIDSRTVKPGELFIPVKGDKHDGRRFIKDALANGAIVLDVKDGQKALQTIAAYYRSKFQLPVIGVTGSVGKTTTKDMLASILSEEKPTLKTVENFNNEIGTPLTLLQLTKKHKFAVVEMAMQRLGEISELTKIVRPTISVITNIGETHLKYLKSKKNVARAKAEIFTCQTDDNYAVINADDEYFEHLRSSVKCRPDHIVTFGITSKADITPKELTGIKLPLAGEHNIYNALAAIAVARILKIKKSSIKNGLEKFRPSSNRYDVINRPDGVKIINDTYNANPQSMTAMLKVLAWLSGRKIAVLGDMNELGARSKKAHQKIGNLVRDLKIDKFIAVGKLARGMKADYHFIDKPAAIKKLKEIMKPGDRILVKASHGLHLEDVVEAIRTI